MLWFLLLACSQDYPSDRLDLARRVVSEGLVCAADAKTMERRCRQASSDGGPAPEAYREAFDACFSDYKRKVAAFEAEPLPSNLNKSGVMMQFTIDQQVQELRQELTGFQASLDTHCKPSAPEPTPAKPAAPSTATPVSRPSSAAPKSGASIGRATAKGPIAGVAPRIVVRHHNALLECVRRAGGAAPLELIVGPDGTVTSVSGGGAAASCLAARAKRMRFPAGSGETHVTIPLAMN